MWLCYGYLRGVVLLWVFKGCGYGIEEMWLCYGYLRGVVMLWVFSLIFGRKQVLNKNII